MPIVFGGARKGQRFNYLTSRQSRDYNSVERGDHCHIEISALSIKWDNLCYGCPSRILVVNWPCWA